MGVWKGVWLHKTVPLYVLWCDFVVAAWLFGTVKRGFHEKNQAIRHKGTAGHVTALPRQRDHVVRPQSC